MRERTSQLERVTGNLCGLFDLAGVGEHADIDDAFIRKLVRRASRAYWLGSRKRSVILGVFPLLVATGLLWYAWRLGRRGRLLSELSRSPAGAIQPGLVKLVGTVVCDEPLHAPCTLRDCVFYRFEIEEEVMRRASDRRQHRVWRRTGKGSESCMFELTDETGAVVVDPRGAVVDAEVTRAKEISSGYARSETSALAGAGLLISTGSGRSGRVRRDEQIVALDARVLVLGTARLDNEQDRIVVGAGEDSPFYISVRPESRVRRTAQVGALIVLVLAAAAAAAVGITARLGESIRERGISDAEIDLVVSDVVVGTAAVLCIGLVWWVWRSTTHRPTHAAPPPDDHPLIQ